MSLLPGIEKAFSQTKSKTKKNTLVLPIQPHVDSDAVKYVTTHDELTGMIELSQQLPLTGISLDFEFNFTCPAIQLRGNKQKYDIRSIRPLLMAVTLASHTQGQMNLHNYVIDLTKIEDALVLQPLLDLPTTYIAHHAKAELHCIWQLGLTAPRIIWDTCIAERARYLGLHMFDNQQHFESLEDEINAKDAHDQSNSIRYALNAVAARYDISHQFNTTKPQLQQSFLNYNGGGFTNEQVNYAAEDAIVAAKLFMPQQQQLMLQGCHNHLITVEMPWVITNAAMEWYGVRIDRGKSEAVLAASLPKLDVLKAKLQLMGLENPSSHQQLQAFFALHNLLHHFSQGDSYSFKKQKLKDLAHIHLAIELIAEFKKVQSISSDMLLQPSIVGADGRVHSDHKQLEVVTGRQSCANPNLLGIPGVMRPLIVPEQGYGIAEADYAQIEIAITAGVYGDQNLIDKFNAGDIYTVMAQEFFADQLVAEYQCCDSDTFKEKHKDKRDIMKQCTLGIIYGLSAFGLASRLKISELEAEQQMVKFLDMFPTLKHMMDISPKQARYRGHVSTQSGLNRYRTNQGVLNRNEKNWMINMPVQGTAAAIFKVAGNRLYQLYKPYNTKLILAMHDAFIYEAPLEHMEEVGKLTTNVMMQAVIEYFPQLKPRIDLNDSQPQCWTKDGDAESIERWIAER